MDLSLNDPKFGTDLHPRWIELYKIPIANAKNAMKSLVDALSRKSYQYAWRGEARFYENATTTSYISKVTGKGTWITTMRDPYSRTDSNYVFVSIIGLTRVIRTAADLDAVADAQRTVGPVTGAAIRTIKAYGAPPQIVKSPPQALQTPRPAVAVAASPDRCVGGERPTTCLQAKFPATAASERECVADSQYQNDHAQTFEMKRFYVDLYATGQSASYLEYPEVLEAFTASAGSFGGKLTAQYPSDSFYAVFPDGRRMGVQLMGSTIWCAWWVSPF